MTLLGLIGSPLSHSRSPEIFSAFFAADGLKHFEYRLFPLSDITEFPNLLQLHPDLIGLNVTIPYKKAVIPFLDNIDPLASETGAVNTIRIERKGPAVKTTGYNTDVDGFEALLKSAEVADAKGAMVLGSGGASESVRVVLQRRGIPFIRISRATRSDGFRYQDITRDHFNTYPLIINTTPAGMFPEVHECPPLPDYFKQHNVLIDLIYNPEETLLMKKARAAGARAFNGLIMLESQAQKAWEIFRG